MKSPFTGKEMLLKKESRSLDFRKEQFPIVYHFYLCEESREQFTTTALDELNIRQLHNQYRTKHNIPFPEEIQKTREKYGLSGIKMAEILGLGVNGYRNYENGEIPSLSNGNLLRLIQNPAIFKDLVIKTDTLNEKEKNKILHKVDWLIEEQKKGKFQFDLRNYLLSGDKIDEYSGFKKPAIDKLIEMTVFFAEKLNPWTVQMNKLLFYADFLMYKRNCSSISGAHYRAINMGPVLNNYKSLFEYMANNSHVEIILHDFGGEEFQPFPGRSFKPEMFSESELEALNEVYERLKFMASKNVSTKNIIEISHEEPAWRENEKDRKLISYEYGFDLIGV